MKIIDILVAKANGILEDGFKFCYENKVYTYNKHQDTIMRIADDIFLGQAWTIEDILNDEVEVIEENKGIEELNAYKLIEEPYMASLLKDNHFDEFMELLKQSELEIVEKIDELVRAVNKINKEREVK